MIDLIGLLAHYLEECHPKGNSQEYRMQSGQVDILYEKLKTSLNDEQKKELCLLTNEYSMLQGCDASENFIYGFKTAFKFILQALNN